MNGIIKKSEFGKTNNYAESYVRNDLVNGELAIELKKEFGDRLIPISLDLISMDGFNLRLKDKKRAHTPVVATIAVVHTATRADALNIASIFS